MTPDEIRSAIAAQPQSEVERSQLITAAIENNMADEIPHEWTVRLTSNAPQYDDTEDLIADQYRMYVEPTNTSDYVDTLFVNAHESGAMSIAARTYGAEIPRSGITPLIKFDIATADDIIQMLVTARGVQIGTRAEISYIQEATTGIEISFSGRSRATEYCPNCSHALDSAGYCVECGYYNPDLNDVRRDVMMGRSTITIPDTFTPNAGPYSFKLTGDSVDELLDGLTAMANSAETAGLSQQEIR